MRSLINFLLITCVLSEDPAKLTPQATTVDATPTSAAPPATVAVTAPNLSSTNPSSQPSGSTTTKARATPLEICQALMVFPKDQKLTEHCRILCQVYSESEVLCPARNSEGGPFNCVVNDVPRCDPPIGTAADVVASESSAAPPAALGLTPPPRTSSNPSSQAFGSTTSKARATPLEICQALMVFPRDQNRTERCRNLCQYYSDSGVLCPLRNTDSGLLNCVVDAVPQCLPPVGTARIALPPISPEEVPAIGDAAAVAYCEAHLGNKWNFATDFKCKVLCQMKGEPGSDCAARHSGEGVIACILAEVNWCQRLDDFPIDL